jgi:hypothetical protein
MAGYIGPVPTPQATQSRDYFTATAGQTSFPTSGYTPGYLDVYLNGVHLQDSDFTATNGSDVVLNDPCAADDVVLVVAWTTFEATNVQFDNVQNKPTTLSGYGITDAATSTQGATADSAVQPGDNVSTLTNDAGYATTSYVDAAESDAVATANAYTDTEIANIDALPSQTGNSGKYLTTNGTSASWADIPEGIYKSSSDPTITANQSLGTVWLNTTSGEMFVCTDATTDNNVWTNVGEGSGNITPSYTVSADVLIVAGGGGGGGSAQGSSAGGGGGAGGYQFYTGKTLNSSTTYTVVVGAGGTNSGFVGTDGLPSSISGLSISPSVGGGGGGRNQSSLSYGRNGGSGGGGGAVYSGGGTTYGGTGTSGQGSNGGSGYDSSDTSGMRGGGGGGASGTGASGGVNSGGIGGAGTSNAITGSSVIYAVGGSGGSWNSTNLAPAQTGGVAGSYHAGNNGHAQQGDGGGGGGGRNASNSSNQDNYGGNGGSGVVILRLPTAYYTGTVTGSPDVTTDGTDTVIKFTSSGSYTA